MPVDPRTDLGDTRPIDRSAGAVTEFPVTRGALGQPPAEEDDYLPEVFDAPPDRAASRAAARSVGWAKSDRESACYSHLLLDGHDNLVVDKTFEFGKPELEFLIATNGYVPRGKNDIIAFGLRGARLRGAEKQELVDRIALEDARPDHLNFRCVIGYYFKATGKISAFTGSTVPWHGYMSSGVRNNFLPTGCYIYKKGVHRPQTEARWVDPALRLSDADGAESGPATVLRTNRDLVFDLMDEWDNCEPSDNIHCAYSNDKFSSLGCQTIKGGLHDGLWAVFQATLKSLPASSRVDYVLLTGAECSIAASLLKAGKHPGDPEARRLTRLRNGSEGEIVKRLQARLGEPETGYFGASAKKKLTEFQRLNKIASDGIFSPDLDAKLGWGVFSVPQASQSTVNVAAKPPASEPSEALGSANAAGAVTQAASGQVAASAALAAQVAQGQPPADDPTIAVAAVTESATRAPTFSFGIAG